MAWVLVSGLKVGFGQGIGLLDDLMVGLWFEGWLKMVWDCFLVTCRWVSGLRTG